MAHEVTALIELQSLLEERNRLLVTVQTPQGFIASVLRAIVAQRLLRRVCTGCTQPVKLDDGQITWLNTVSSGEYDSGDYYKGNGCSHCNNTGYHGRIGIYEMIEPDKTMLEAIRSGDITEFSKAVSENKNYVPLLERGLQLAGPQALGGYLQLPAWNAQPALQQRRRR